MAEHLNQHESPNQPFHDLLSAFGQAIIANLQSPNGMIGYPTELLRQYERRIDELLATRDTVDDAEAPEEV